jgi:hypothetical protein
MQGVYRSDGIVPAQDDHDTFTNHDEIGMGHAYSFTTGQFNHKWLKAVGNLFTNPLEIHTVSIAQFLGVIKVNASPSAA